MSIASSSTPHARLPPGLEGNRHGREPHREEDGGGHHKEKNRAAKIGDQADDILWRKYTKRVSCLFGNPITRAGIVKRCQQEGWTDITGNDIGNMIKRGWIERDGDTNYFENSCSIDF